MAIRMKDDKIEEALALLNEAALEKRDEMVELIGDHYGHVRDLFCQKITNGRDAVRQARLELLKSLEEKEEELMEKTKSLGRKVRRSPWKYLAGVAVGTWLVAYLVHRK